ncbi:MAG: IclR family transcriptional regulator [Thermomicrobiales bacterium]
MPRRHVDHESGQGTEEADVRSDLTLSTLDKGLRILELLAEEDSRHGLTLTEIGRALGMHRSTLFRFLATLRPRGYLERDPVSDRYRLGARVLTLSGAFLDALDIRDVARPELEMLCDETQELVHLATLDHDDVVTIERIEGRQPVSLQTGIGERRPAYCTASGKAILAYLPTEKLDSVLAQGMPAYTSRTITSPMRMREHLARVRTRGYAVDDEERIEGVRCVASPVFGHDGEVVAAVSVAAPSHRASDERLSQIGARCRVAADAVSRRLGCTTSRTGVSGEELVLAVSGTVEANA